MFSDAEFEILPRLTLRRFIKKWRKHDPATSQLLLWRHLGCKAVFKLVSDLTIQTHLHNYIGTVYERKIRITWTLNHFIYVIMME